MFVAFVVLTIVFDGGSGDGCSCSCEHEERHYTDEERREGLHLPDRDKFGPRRA